MQRIREAEQQSKRRALNLPAPQVSEAELEEIVKMGMAGGRAVKAAGEDGERGLVSNYANMVGATPIRTPRATPLRTPRDNFAINGMGNRQPVGNVAAQFTQLYSSQSQVAQTSRDVRIVEITARQTLRTKLSSLPKPKETEWEFEELPSEAVETNGDAEPSHEDQEEIDRREREMKEAAAAAEFKRQTQVFQRSLPRPPKVNYQTMLHQADAISDPIKSMIAREMATLMAKDADEATDFEPITDGDIAKARLELAGEVNDQDQENYVLSFEQLERSRIRDKSSQQHLRAPYAAG